MQLLRRHEPWVFLFGIVVLNALFISAIAADKLPGSLYNMGRFALLGAFLLAVVFLARGAGGVAALLRPMLVWRVMPWWFLLAASWGTMNCIAVLAIKGLLTGNGLNEIQTSFSVIQRPQLIKVILISSFIGEIVWIGYAVQRLCTRFTAFISALIVGAFWTAWWAPMVAFKVGVVPDLPLGALLLNQSGIAVMCAFFYARTNSALVVFTMQVFFNSAILVFPVAPTTGGILTYWGFAAFYFITSTTVFALYGPHPMFGRADKIHRSVA